MFTPAHVIATIIQINTFSATQIQSFYKSVVFDFVDSKNSVAGNDNLVIIWKEKSYFKAGDRNL